MKKLIVFLLAVSIFSCDDGDFDVPSFEFSETVQSCGEYILYKTNENSTEVIVITLDPSSLPTTPGEIEIQISGTQTVIYRIFNDGITTDYFCQSIPPSTPTVLKELIASSGTILISSTELLNNSDEVIGLNHDISILDLIFTDNEERIFFESFDFGSIEIAN